MNVTDKAYRLLNRQLRRLATSRDIRTRLKKLSPHTAESEWESNGKVDVNIDNDTTGRINAFGHELIHILYEHRYEGLPYELEEPQVEALEKGWMEYLQGDKRRMEWWRRTVRRYLNQRHKKGGYGKTR
jgi:hypothetical protein